MEKESPVELRKMLEMVEAMKRGGIGFVAVPYTSQEEKNELLALCRTNLDKLED